MKQSEHEDHKRLGRWIFVDVQDIKTPMPGRICHGPSWWKVTQNNEVLFFDNYSSPQCNANKSIASRIGCGFGAPETHAVFIKMAFIPHNCSDYC